MHIDSAKDVPSLVGLDMDELKAALASVGLEGYRAKQVWQWLYHHGVSDFEGMSNLSKAQRQVLAEHFTVARPVIHTHQLSEDGTQKWLLEYRDGNKAEMVFIPEKERGTLCISSQVGCTLTCTFCHTGTQRLVRNLTAEEIVAQVLVARDAIGEWPSPPDGRLLTNIVLMGMGEPLYNYDNVAKAMQIVMHSDGLNMSRRRITLSTSGIVPEIERCGRELDINLAISLHAVRDELRDELVPINRKYPLSVLLDACRDYPASSDMRRITFEYVMLKGVNDSDEDAHALVALMRHLPAKINLIPFNSWPGAPYECSSNNRIRQFARIVENAGYASPVRTPRGQDIFAACGQLKSDSERQSKSRLQNQA